MKPSPLLYSLSDDEIAPLLQRYGVEGYGVFVALIDLQIRGKFPYPETFKLERFRWKISWSKEQVLEFYEFLISCKLMSEDFISPRVIECVEVKKKLSNSKRKGAVAMLSKKETKPPFPDAEQLPFEEVDLFNENKKYTFEDFIVDFNVIRSKAFSCAGMASRGVSGDVKAEKQFKNFVSKKFKREDCIYAVSRLFEDDHHIGSGFKWATPELITRPDKFVMYHSRTENNKKGPNSGIYT